MKKSNFAGVIAMVLVGGIISGVLLSEFGVTKAFARSIPFIGGGADDTPATSVDLAPLWKVWNTLDSKFVDSTPSTTLPEEEEKVWAMMKGLTESFKDPYTVFMPPEQTKLFKEEISGSFGGVGMEVGLNKEGFVTVITPLKDTPAERAGIQAGDLITAINGTSTEGFAVDEAVRLIRGEKGTPVTFTMVRGQKEVEITVVRDTINIPTIKNYKEENAQVYTIELYSFTAQSPQLFEKAMDEFKASGLSKLIIDLRGNPGGYLNAANLIASHFLPANEVIVTEDYQQKQPSIVHRSNGGEFIDKSTEVVVLINKGSASASEIVAGALKDHKRATVIGETSFGKGSVQELIDIEGASLKVTVAKWLTPSGKSLSFEGVHPDIEVVRPESDIEEKKDSQKLRALEFFATGK